MAEQYSPDGRYKWDGHEWQLVAPASPGREEVAIAIAQEPTDNQTNAAPMMVEELIAFVRTRHAGLRILLRPGGLRSELMRQSFLALIPDDLPARDDSIAFIRAVVPGDEDNVATAKRKILEQQVTEQKALKGWQPLVESGFDRFNRLLKEGVEWEGQNDAWNSLKDKIERRLNSVTRSEFAPSWGVMDDFEKMIALAASYSCDLEFVARADGEYHMLIATAPMWSDPQVVVEDDDLRRFVGAVSAAISQRRA